MAMVAIVLQDLLLRTVTKWFKQFPTEEFESRIRSIQDIDQLEELSVRVMDVKSWGELLASL
jgi:hypothetical protein